MNSKLDGKMEDKEYRDLFSESQIRRGVPLQIRAMRADRGWTQAELGEVAGMPQSVISRIENSRTINLSIRTLLKLARTFDVGLVVRFEPYSRLIDWADGLSATDMAVPSYDKEVASKKSEGSASNALGVEIRASTMRESASAEAPNGTRSTFGVILPRGQQAFSGYLGDNPLPQLRVVPSEGTTGSKLPERQLSARVFKAAVESVRTHQIR